MEVNFICPNWSIIGLVRLTKPSNYLTRVNICLQNFDKFPLNHCDQKSRISLGNSAITQRCVLPVSFPVDLLKVRKFQKENMELSHCPKYERKISKILPWTLGAESFKYFRSYFGQFDDFTFSFWNLLTFTMAVMISPERKLAKSTFVTFQKTLNIGLIFFRM